MDLLNDNNTDTRKVKIQKKQAPMATPKVPKVIKSKAPRVQKAPKITAEATTMQKQPAFSEKAQNADDAPLLPTPSAAPILNERTKNEKDGEIAEYAPAGFNLGDSQLFKQQEKYISSLEQMLKDVSIKQEALSRQVASFNQPGFSRGNDNYGKQGITFLAP